MNLTYKTKNQIREGSQIFFFNFMVFDHTPLTPPPWSTFMVPLLQIFLTVFFLQEMEHITLEMDFYWRKNLYCLQIFKLEVYGR